MYVASETRYDNMQYRRCGNSGIQLPVISLGLWHNFGSITPFDTQQKILRTAFDNGITHFDLANNWPALWRSGTKFRHAYAAGLEALSG